jgi:transcriptional regulator with XRE-family HTH domain
VETLREFRRQKGWSQKDLADESGVGQDTISGIESGRHEPRPSTLRKLAEALDVEVADFFKEPALPLAEAPKTGPTDSDWSLVSTEHVEFLDSLGEALEGLNQRTQERLDRSGDNSEALVALFQDTFISITGAMSLMGDIEEQEKQLRTRSKEERRARARVERAATKLQAIFDDMIAGLEAADGAEVTHMEEYLQRRRAG